MRMCVKNRIFIIIITAALSVVSVASKSFSSTAAIIPGLGSVFGKDGSRHNKDGNNNSNKKEATQPVRPQPLPPSSGYNSASAGPQQQRQVQQTRQNYVPRGDQRPPPPPPPPGATANDIEGRTSEQEGKSKEETAQVQLKEPMSKANDAQQQQQTQQGEEVDFRQHTPTYWNDGSAYDPYGVMPPPPPVAGWMGPPPHTEWGQSIWQQDYEGDEGGNVERIRQELDESVSREAELLLEIQNLTAAVATFEQREDLHLRQLDVLTESVMHAEAELAAERNAAVEFRNNCTDLGRALELMQDEMEEWKEICANLTSIHEADEERILELKQNLFERTAELEDLAATVEKARLLDEREKYLADRKKKHNRGFFAWLFGFGRDEETEDERLQHAQELAKSTLLQALQNERNSVHELEAALLTLQQNNSAISEMVSSRDTLINELNERVAVFEEDKMVLKAALKQLQKEMKDEEPKTKKLIDDLQIARDEIKSLKAEIESIIQMHSEEVALLKDTINTKQVAINETESNLTVIGTYVDKLEDRLASFAIARRDIDLREEKCDRIEERAIELETEKAALQSEIKKYAEEQSEIKEVMEELYRERKILNEEKETMTTERNELIKEAQSLRNTIASLEHDLGGLDGILEEWKSKAEALEATIQEQQTELDAMATKEASLHHDQSVREEELMNEVADAKRRADELESHLASLAKEASEARNKTVPPPLGASNSSETNGMHPPADIQITIVSNTDDVEDQSARTIPNETAMVSSTIHLVANETSHSSKDIDAPKLPPEPSVPKLPSAPAKKGAKIQFPPGKQPKSKQGPPRRKVPFRQIRKVFAKATGIRGVFTPPSRPGNPRRRPLVKKKTLPPPPKKFGEDRKNNPKS